MIIGHKIEDKKLQFDINREVAKISALSSGKVPVDLFKNSVDCNINPKEVLKD